MRERERGGEGEGERDFVYTMVTSGVSIYTKCMYTYNVYNGWKGTRKEAI